ncbi:MAG: RNA polymerase sigma factor [bacterium]
MSLISESQFLILYDQYVDKIYRYIFFRIGSEEAAKDLTSEVFLKSWQYLNRSNTESRRELANPRAFIYQVARNLLVDFYRQKDKLPISLDEIADKSIADKNDDQIERTSRSLEMESVRGALAYLSEEYQEVIIWRYLDELEIKEICEILDKSEGAVRVLLSRALSGLKLALNKQAKGV